SARPAAARVRGPAPRPVIRSAWRARGWKGPRSRRFPLPARGDFRQPPEDAIWKEHHHHDQQQPDPEIPELRADAGELVARDHVDDGADDPAVEAPGAAEDQDHQDRKSTRLNSSHGSISYAVFCLKKKKTS